MIPWSRPYILSRLVVTSLLHNRLSVLFAEYSIEKMVELEHDDLLLFCKDADKFSKHRKQPEIGFDLWAATGASAACLLLMEKAIRPHTTFKASGDRKVM
jgi:hypothetical protein